MEAANKKLSQIYARSKTSKNPSFSHIEQQAGNALIDIISHFDGENKRFGQFIELHLKYDIKFQKLNSSNFSVCRNHKRNPYFHNLNLK